LGDHQPDDQRDHGGAGRHEQKQRDDVPRDEAEIVKRDADGERDDLDRAPR
jgi:hypothetical protein